MWIPVLCKIELREGFFFFLLRKHVNIFSQSSLCFYFLNRAIWGANTFFHFSFMIYAFCLLVSESQRFVSYILWASSFSFYTWIHCPFQVTFTYVVKEGLIQKLFECLLHFRTFVQFSINKCSKICNYCHFHNEENKSQIKSLAQVILPGFEPMIPHNGSKSPCFPHPIMPALCFNIELGSVLKISSCNLWGGHKNMR